MRNGWNYLPLGEVCRIKPPKKEAKERLNQTDLVSFVPMHDLGIRKKYFSPVEEKLVGKVSGSYTYFAEGDVLLAKITPCFENGKLGIARGLTNRVGFGSSEFIVFRPGDLLNPEFLFYYLSQDSFRDAGQRVMSGAVGHKRVPKEFIENHLIPLPPLKEQKRIVAILDEAFTGIDAAIANTEKNLANARELFQSSLSSLFSQSAEWNEWELKDIVGSDCSLSYGIVQPGADVPDGLPVVRPTDLNKRVITTNGLKRIDPEKAKSYTRTALQGNELLLCVRGSTGTVSVASKELQGANVTRGIVPIRFDEQIVKSEFGYYLLISPNFQKQIADRTYGAALMQINIRDLKTLKLRFPALLKQEELASKIDLLESELLHLGSNYRRKREALFELKQSLLQKAFSGELTGEFADKEVGEAVA